MKKIVLVIMMMFVLISLVKSQTYVINITTVEKKDCEIRGRVMLGDELGRGTRVVLINQLKHEASYYFTDSLGNYKIPNLKIDEKYMMLISAKGYKQELISDIKLENNEHLYINFTLKK